MSTFTFPLQTIPPHDHLPTCIPERVGHRLGERDGPAVAATEDDDDDRRVHRRQRGREGAHEDVEPPRHEVQLRGRLSDPHRLPDVPPDERKGTTREEFVQEFCFTRVFAARFWVTEPGGVVPDGADAEPDVGGQRRCQREDARVAATGAGALARRRQVPAAARQQAARARTGGQAQRGGLALRATQDLQPQQRQPPHGQQLQQGT